MGLLDSGPLSSPDSQIAIAAGLLSGTGNFGANLSRGLLAAQQAQVQERANRQNDLQQLTGAYSMLKQQEFAKMLAAKNAGQPYVPNPMLPQMEQRIAQLTGLPNLANQGPVGSRVPSAPQPMPQGAAPPQGPPMPPQGPSQMPPGMSQGAPQGMPPQGMPPQQGMPQGLSPQQQASPFGGPAMGIDPLEFMSVDPSGKSYMDALVKQATPITTRFGVYGLDAKNPGQVRLMGGMVPKDALNVEMGPDGKPRIQELPGQVQTQQDLAEASARGQAAGQFPGRVENVTTASGAVQPQLLSKVVGNPYANPASLPQVGQAPSNRAQVTVTQPSKQAQATPVPPGDPWATIPKRYAPQGMGQSTFDKGMAEKAAQQAYDLSAKYGEGADAANQRIALNNQAMGIVDKADTGPMAARIGDVKNWLTQRFGIPESSFANTPSADQELQKDLLNAATAKAKAQFGSRMTQSEVMLMLTRGAPNVDMTKAAIKFLLQSDNVMQGYAIKQAQDFGKYLQLGGEPSRFGGWYAGAFPASKELETVKPNAQPVSIDDLVNKYRSKGGDAR